MKIDFKAASRDNFSDKNDKKDSVTKTSLKTPTTSTAYSSNWKQLIESNMVNKCPPDKLDVSERLVKNTIEPKCCPEKKKRSIKTDLSCQSPTKKRFLSVNPISSNETKPKIDVVNGKFSGDVRTYDVNSSVSKENCSKPCEKHSEKQQISSKDKEKKKNSADPAEKETGLTKCLAIDCEFVGVGDGKDDMVARVSLVNLYGHCVYDKYVAPVEDVVDYRTSVSGIRPEHLRNAEKLQTVQKDVTNMIKGRILIGHGVKKDLKVLFLSHPVKYLRDTSTFRAFREIAKTRFPSLKKLASLVLGVSIQNDEHDSVVDARVAMQLYRTRRKEWEATKRRRKNKS